MKVTTAAYNKLKKFAASGGSPSMIGTLIGSLKESDIQAHLKHMKATDPALYKSWGSKYSAPADEPEDEEDIDVDAMLAEDDEDDTPATAPPAKPAPAAKKKEATKGLDDLFDEEPATSKGVMVTVDEDGGGMNVPVGTSMHIPEKFRLRNADGTDTTLEVFSRSAKFGYIVRIPVPTDMRTITIGDTSYQVDLLALRRDPDGMTELGGKKRANSKLALLAEMDD